MSDIEKNRLAKAFSILYEEARTPAFRENWMQAATAHSKGSRPLLRPALAVTLSLCLIIAITILLRQESSTSQPKVQAVTETIANEGWAFSSDFLLSQNYNEPFYYTDFLLEISDNSTLTGIPVLESSLFNDSEDI